MDITSDGEESSGIASIPFLHSHMHGDIGQIWSLSSAFVVHHKNGTRQYGNTLTRNLAGCCRLSCVRGEVDLEDVAATGSTVCDLTSTISHRLVLIIIQASPQTS